MAAFDLLKRLMSGAGAAERRQDDRLRAPTGLRVLVVDDSPTIRAVLGKMLLQDGYMVSKAANGDEALALARSEQPGLIFLDIVLPGISGFSVLRTLRRDPLTQSIPIVMISGNLQATEQFYVQRFGADDFMKKPFGRAEVFERIRSLVSTGRLPQREQEVVAAAEIEHGLSAEEWNAIPDVALPDAGPGQHVELSALSADASDEALPAPAVAAVVAAASADDAASMPATEPMPHAAEASREESATPQVASEPAPPPHAEESASVVVPVPVAEPMAAPIVTVAELVVEAAPPPLETASAADDETGTLPAEGVANLADPAPTIEPVSVVAAAPAMEAEDFGRSPPAAVVMVGDAGAPPAPLPSAATRFESALDILLDRDEGIEVSELPADFDLPERFKRPTERHGAAVDAQLDTVAVVAAEPAAPAAPASADEPAATAVVDTPKPAVAVPATAPKPPLDEDDEPDQGMFWP